MYKSIETEHWSVVARAGGKGEMRIDYLLMGKMCILGVINTLELDSGDGSITLRIY